MLGTNDLKHKFAATAYDIARGAAVLVDMIQRSRTGTKDSSPAVLLVAPPPVAHLLEFAEMFAGAEPKSRQLAAQYQAVSRELGSHFLDAGKVVRSSDVDGIHLSPNAHLSLGRAVKASIDQMQPCRTPKGRA